MGTRADFYVGNGKDAEWIGSVAWDGYEWGDRIAEGDNDEITISTDEQQFRDAVLKKLESRRDGTKPEDGWPWPWDDSTTTDCSYCFINGKVEAFRWGRPWASESEEKSEWPNMKDVKNITMGKRSGLIVLSV